MSRLHNSFQDKVERLGHALAFIGMLGVTTTLIVVAFTYVGVAVGILVSSVLLLLIGIALMNP